MSDTDSIDDAGILARTLWSEARGEGSQGMQAVANVIMNRAANPKWWGISPRSVCLHPWQFSCWNQNDPNRAKMLAVTAADLQFAEALEIAAAAIAGTLPDITSRATSYYAAGSPMPRWAIHQKPCATIGHHLFFNV